MLAAAPPPPPASPLRGLANVLYRRRRLLLVLLLAPPLAWLGVIYLGSLFALLAQSFFSIDTILGWRCYPDLASVICVFESLQINHGYVAIDIH